MFEVVDGPVVHLTFGCQGSDERWYGLDSDAHGAGQHPGDPLQEPLVGNEVAGSPTAPPPWAMVRAVVIAERTCTSTA